jgi:Cu2+-exporting ATPase
LLTNGNAIEALARTTRIVFDKTGTLTEGRPAIVSTTVLDSAYTEDQCRDIAAALEAASTHPIAAAFELDTMGVRATDHRIAVGEGVAGTVEGRRWRIGTASFVSVGAASAATATTGSTIIHLGTEGHLVARFTLDDKMRDDARAVLEQIRALGPAISLASGDSEEAVRRTASALGIENFRARCTPDDKLDYLRDYQRQGDTVVMVGDGINDAPVLAGADASVAMAEGALLAQTSADLIMLGHSLKPLLTALSTARQTMRIVRQNLAWAIVYNVTAVPLAALGYVPPWAAAIGMSASSLIVVLNALRLSRYGEA